MQRLGPDSSPFREGSISALACHLFALFFSLSPLASAPTHADKLAAQDIADFSLEELSNIEVTSVSRQAERLQDAPASIYVITGDEIRRSGVTSLPEALRLAPNLQVARVNARQYAISARGFNNSIGNKLLVLIDGRTVYTPLFSGVFWDAQDVMLQDVERIEVISGPGATLWGANAVNGVINVITRSAAHTQGAFVSAGAGNRENSAAFRYGGPLSTDGHYRVYAMGFERDNTERADGTAIRDSWDKWQAGFRTDWGTPAQGFTFQGDAYSGNEEQTLPSDIRIKGINLLGRWNRQLSENSALRVQTYYDRIEREQPGSFAEKLDILDIEFQHTLGLADRNKLIWGGGYRYARDQIQNSPGLAFLPADRDLHWSNVFVQDEFPLTGHISMTVGGKAESNPYTGVEFLPSARVAWKLSPDRLVWGALSRAVRAPSRLDRELFAPAAPPFIIAGGPDFQSEISNVIEIGYRAQPSQVAFYSITAFHHVHDKLRSIEPTPGGAFVLANKIEGTTSGVEAWAAYQMTATWKLSGGAVWLDQDLKRKPDSLDPAGPRSLGNDPELQWMVRSVFDITPKHGFDVTVRHVDSLPDPPVPSYTAVDVRYAWKPRPGLELSLMLQDLFDSGHIEFGQQATASVLPRSLFLQLRWEP